MFGLSEKNFSIEFTNKNSPFRNFDDLSQCSQDVISNSRNTTTNPLLAGAMLSLFILTHVMLAVSILCTTVGLFLLLMLRGHIIRSRITLMQLNYGIALLLALIALTAGLTGGRLSADVCRAVVLIIDYLWSVFYSAGASYSLVLACSAVTANKKQEINIVIVLSIVAASWILPLLQVGVTMGLVFEYLVNISDHCFLSYDGNLMWGLIAPMLFMVAISLILTCVVWVSRKIILKRRQGGRKLKYAFSCSIGNCILQSLLLLPWLLHSLNVVTGAYQKSQLIEWIFLLLLGLTGAGYLTLVVLFNPRVRLLCKRKRRAQELPLLGPLSTCGLKSRTGFELTLRKKPQHPRVIGTYYKKKTEGIYLSGQPTLHPASEERRPVELTKPETHGQRAIKIITDASISHTSPTEQESAAYSGASSFLLEFDGLPLSLASDDSSEFLSDDSNETRI